MASLRLNAADRHHRLPADADQIPAQSKGEEAMARESQLPGANEDDAIGETSLGEDVEDLAESDLERLRHVVGERQRSGTRTALSAVDRNEIDTSAPVLHRCRELAPEFEIANRGFEADGQSGLGGQKLDEVEHAVDVGEFAVPWRTDAGCTDFDSADRRDLRCDLGAGSTPPRPGLAPWLSSISMARIGAADTVSRSFSMSNRPLRSRHPK
jgi:hypothetical protein